MEAAVGLSCVRAQHRPGGVAAPRTNAGEPMPDSVHSHASRRGKPTRAHLYADIAAECVSLDTALGQATHLKSRYPP